MLDPISLLLMAQSAVGAISKGCEMLREGKAEIDKFKSTVESSVKNAQAIYKEVTGLWAWFLGLIGKKPAAKVVLSPPVELKSESKDELKPASKTTSKKRAEPAPELSYEEFQARAVHDICEHLKVYFDAMQGLKAHCRELEEASLTTENVAESAIDRIEIEWQMRQLSAQLKQAMIYGTPKELGLGAMYEEFLIKYDEIVEAQEVARAVKTRNERDAAWQRDLLRNHRIDRAIASVGVVVLILWMWAVLLSLGWLVKIPNGLSSVL